VKILPLPLALPGKCLVCGASDNNDGREYIDIGFELDFYGVIYFCTHCFGEVALGVGFTKIKNVEDLNNEYHKLMLELAGVSAENVKLRVALNSLDFLGATELYDDVGSGVESTTEESGSNDSKLVKQVDESRPTNVPKARKSKQSTAESEFDELI
jgi:hypothetical protein